jgi:hypothetical protein
MTQHQRQKQVQKAEEDLKSGVQQERVTEKLDDGQAIYSKANHFVACSGIESLQYSVGRLCCFQARKSNQQHSVHISWQDFVCCEHVFGFKNTRSIEFKIHTIYLDNYNLQEKYIQYELQI